MDGVEEWVEDEFMERSSHALVTETGTWLIDPVDGPRIDALENVTGVIQLLDRHNRDCARIAGRLGVPHVVLPDAPIPPFVFIRISRHEVALWWDEKRVPSARKRSGPRGSSVRVTNASPCTRCCAYARRNSTFTRR